MSERVYRAVRLFSVITNGLIAVGSGLLGIVIPAYLPLAVIATAAFGLATRDYFELY